MHVATPDGGDDRVAAFAGESRGLPGREDLEHDRSRDDTRRSVRPPVVVAVRVKGVPGTSVQEVGPLHVPGETAREIVACACVTIWTTVPELDEKLEVPFVGGGHGEGLAPIGEPERHVTCGHPAHQWTPPEHAPAPANLTFPVGDPTWVPLGATCAVKVSGCPLTEGFDRRGDGGHGGIRRAGRPGGRLENASQDDRHEERRGARL